MRGLETGLFVGTAADRVQTYIEASRIPRRKARSVVQNDEAAGSLRQAKGTSNEGGRDEVDGHDWFVIGSKLAGLHVSSNGG